MTNQGIENEYMHFILKPHLSENAISLSAIKSFLKA